WISAADTEGHSSGCGQIIVGKQGKLRSVIQDLSNDLTHGFRIPPQLAFHEANSTVRVDQRLSTYFSVPAALSRNSLQTDSVWKTPVLALPVGGFRRISAFPEMVAYT